MAPATRIAMAGHTFSNTLSLQLGALTLTSACALLACGGDDEVTASPGRARGTGGAGAATGAGGAGGGTVGAAGTYAGFDGGLAAADAGKGKEECTVAGDDAIDENGNGEVDEGCSCEIGSSQQCCATGIQLCNTQGGEFGSYWGPCLGGSLGKEICGDGLDQDCNGQDLECPDVTVACNSSPHLSTKVSVAFPGNGPVCPWGQGDNDSYTSGHHAARIEHLQSMSLPAGAIICDMSFNVPQTGMYYDDVLLLTFNDAILMAAMKVETIFPNQGGLFLYDWAQLRGKPFEYALYCLGGTATCALPESQNQGTISLQIPEPLVHLLSKNALNEHKFDFAVIVTADNDPDKDCYYSAFTLEMDVEYVMP